MAKKEFIVSLVLISLLVGMQAVNVTKANPTWGVYPTEPTRDKPFLVFENPENYSICTQGNVTLNFTIFKPSSWNMTLAPFGSCANGRIDSVNVSLNGVQEFQEFLWFDPLNGGGSWNKSYSVSIGELQRGINAVEVIVSAMAFTSAANYPMNVTATIYLNQATSSDDWPMPGHDPANTGFTTSLTPANLSLIWSFPDPATSSVGLDHKAVYSAPAVANGYLYVNGATTTGGLYCLNATTGKLVWSQTYLTQNPSNVTLSTSTPTIYNGYLYLGDYGLVALNASTGKLVWSSASLGGSLVQSGGVIYVQSFNCAYAVDASNGTLIWNFINPEGYVGVGVAPTFSEGFLYAAMSHGSLSDATGCIFAIDASTGKQVWNYTTTTIILSSPAIYQGRLYLGTLNGTVYSIDATTGVLSWNVSSTDNALMSGSPAVAYGRVFIASTTSIYGLNASSGIQLWSKPIGSYSSPAIADGKVYFQSRDFYLYSLNASTGQVLWKYLTVSALDKNALGNSGGAGASPAVAYGNIYVGTNEANVLAFGSPTSSQSSSFPSPSVPEAPPEIVLASIIAATALTWLVVTFSRTLNTRRPKQERRSRRPAYLSSTSRM